MNLDLCLDNNFKRIFHDFFEAIYHAGFKRT